MFIAALFRIATHGDNLISTIDEWVEEVWYVYAKEYYSAIKRTK